MSLPDPAHEISVLLHTEKLEHSQGQIHATGQYTPQPLLEDNCQTLKTNTEVHIAASATPSGLSLRQQGGF